MMQHSSKCSIVIVSFAKDLIHAKLPTHPFFSSSSCIAVAPFRIIRAAAPYMRIKDADKRENRSVIFVSSTTGTHGNTGQLNYAAAKSGTYHYMKYYICYNSTGYCSLGLGLYNSNPN